MEADDGESVEIENIIINRISTQKVTEGTYLLFKINHPILLAFVRTGITP